MLLLYSATYINRKLISFKENNWILELIILEFIISKLFINRNLIYDSEEYWFKNISSQYSNNNETKSINLDTLLIIISNSYNWNYSQR